MFTGPQIGGIARAPSKPPEKHRRPGGPAGLLVLVAAVSGLPGCYSYHVSPPHPDPVTEYHEEDRTVHGLFWGLVQDPQTVVAKDCESNALDDVRVSTNYAYAFVTVITLGIVAPLDVNWRCAEASDGGDGAF